MTTERNSAKKNADDKLKKRSRLTTEDWYKRYKKAIIGLSLEKRQLLEEYRPDILEGIELAIKYTPLNQLVGIDQILVCYEFELIILFKDDILKKNVPYRVIRSRSFKLTKIRRGSWFDLLVKQWETFDVFSQGKRISFSDNGRFIDAEIPQPSSDLRVHPSSLYHLSPETFFIRKELSQLIDYLPEKIRKSGRKWAHVYQKIIEMQIGGVDVVGKHKEVLGLKTAKQVRELKHQALKLAAKIMADWIPELKTVQDRSQNKKKKKWKVISSTFEERKEFYRVQDTDVMKPKTIRIWHVYDGEKLKRSKMNKS